MLQNIEHLDFVFRDIRNLRILDVLGAMMICIYRNYCLFLISMLFNQGYCDILCPISAPGILGFNWLVHKYPLSVSHDLFFHSFIILLVEMNIFSCHFILFSYAVFFHFRHSQMFYTENNLLGTFGTLYNVIVKHTLLIFCFLR